MKKTNPPSAISCRCGGQMVLLRMQGQYRGYCSGCLNATPKAKRDTEIGPLWRERASEGKLKPIPGLSTKQKALLKLGAVWMAKAGKEITFKALRDTRHRGQYLKADVLYLIDEHLFVYLPELAGNLAPLTECTP